MPEENTGSDITVEEGKELGNDFFANGQSNSDSVGGFWGSDLGTENDGGNFDELLKGNKSNGSTSVANEKLVDWNPFNTDRILGMPLYYNDFADPAGRVFTETIIADIPQIFFIPGEPQVNRRLIDFAGNRIVPATLSRAILEAKEIGLNFNVRGIFSGTDLRFIGFKPAYAEYFKYVQLLLSTIWSYFDNTGVFESFRFSDVFSTELSNYGLCFYGDKATSVTESADNTYAPMQVTETANSSGQAMRESKLLSPTASTASTLLQSIRDNNPSAILDSVMTFDGIINRTANALFRTVNGSQLFFPDIWEGSNFDKSYNLSFKFYSPYGDKLSIFRFVYVPFIALLCLALP